MKATISILTHTALPQAKTCIAAVLAGGGDFDLILMANGNPEAEKYFCDLVFSRTDIRVVINDINLGFIDPNRTALEMTHSDIFVMLNDDCIVPRGWLDLICREFKKDPNCAIVGPVGRRLGDDFVGGKPGKPVEYIEGVCMAVRTDLAKKHGLFDPNIHFAYGEDSDLCLRMRQLGYSIKVAPFGIIHKSGTTSRHVPTAGRHFAMNHMYLKTKWRYYLKTHKFPHE